MNSYATFGLLRESIIDQGLIGLVALIWVLISAPAVDRAFSLVEPVHAAPTDVPAESGLFDPTLSMGGVLGEG